MSEQANKQMRRQGEIMSHLYILNVKQEGAERCVEGERKKRWRSLEQQKGIRGN